MKLQTILFAGLMIGGMAAHATPAVGDDNMYNVTVTQNGTTETGTFEISITAYDASSDNYTVHQDVELNGGPQQSQDQQTPAANLMSDAQIADALTNCANYGGQSQTYTVGGTDYPTCVLNQQADQNGNTGVVYVGQVPFGVLKQIVTSPSGEVQTLELAHFSGN